MRLVVQPSAWAGVAFLLASYIGPALSQPVGKPRVPPGHVPSSIAIAIIGNGIDYTQPMISVRLARDGEGELVGWDFLDDDRRPYAACLPPESGVICHHLHALAPLLEAGPLIAPFRASPDKPQSLVSAVQAIAQTNIRVVMLITEPALPMAFLRDAATRYPNLVFIGAVSDEGPALLRQRNIFAISTTAQQVTGRAHYLAATLAMSGARCLLRDTAQPSASVLDCATQDAGLRVRGQGR